jgi:hypothetical protein
MQRPGFGRVFAILGNLKGNMGVCRRRLRKGRDHFDDAEVP